MATRKNLSTEKIPVPDDEDFDSRTSKITYE